MQTLKSGIFFYVCRQVVWLLNINIDIMRLRLLSLLSVLFVAFGASAQGARDFKINEIYIADPADTSGIGYKDEYGESGSWIEVANTSYTTRDIRSCYLTNNRAVLNKELSAPERISMMSLIPKGDVRTNLTAKQRITFFADGHVNRGTLHTDFVLEAGKENFIALYDGNGVTLLDSVTVPVLPTGCSYARVYDADSEEYVWVKAQPDEVTPDAPNEVSNATDDKVKQFKDNDPYGIAMTVMSMAVVFSCLLLLYIFFHVFGWIINRMTMLSRVKAIKKIHESAAKVVVMAKDGAETKGIEMENYVAAIAMALHEYQGYTHDVESGVLTIRHEHSAWDSKDHGLRQQPVHHPVNTHN